MSRVPANPYRVFVQRKPVQNGGPLPPLECHSFANLTEANLCRDQNLKKPYVRFVTTALVLDEATAASHQAALETIERQRQARAVRVASRITRI